MNHAPVCTGRPAPLEKPDARHAELPGASLTAVTTLAALLAGVLLMLAGCATRGDEPTHRALIDPLALGGAGPTAASTTPWPAPRWWTSYGDAQLDALIDKAIADQPSLQTALARARLAQAAVDRTGASRQAQVNGSVELTDQRFTEHGLVPPALAGATRWNNNAQVGVSWEFDLFGRQRAALDAAIGQLRAAEADAQAARVLLASSVAQAYFQLAGLIDARGVAMLSLQQRGQVLALVRQRIEAGLDTSVELRQAEGQVAQSRVEIEALGELITRSRHALAELSGQGPGALDTLSPALAPLTSGALPDKLPADLLGRRADLVAQRWRVEAALRDIDLARTEFYPNLNLSAFVGLSSIGLDQFINIGSRTYGAGPALHLPIFDGGRLRANLSARGAEADVAIDAYNAALLRALREVADELASLQSLQRQGLAQTEATTSAEAAYDLAMQRYRAGLGNFLIVLTAQTNVLAQRRATAELKARHLSSEVALKRALGGGFESGADALPTLAQVPSR